MARPRKAADPAQVVSQVLAETLPGLQEHAQRMRRFDRAYNIWRGLSQTTSQTRNMQNPSRMRVKYGMQVIDQEMVNVVQGAPKALCTPRNPNHEGAAKAMEQILAYYGDLDHLAEHEPLIVQQALVYGVSPAKTAWLYRENTMPRGWDPVARRWNPGMVSVVADDRPTMIPWDAYDCWWEPLARDPDNAAYIVFREWPSKDELEQRRKNPDSGMGMLENLDLLYQSGADKTIEPTAQNQLLGFPGNGIHKGRYELWEIWRDNRLTIIGNRTVKLYDGPKPYWMPGKPGVIGNSRPDFLRIEGVSETDLVDDLQQGLWTHENMVMDNMKMTVMRGATVRETVPDINQLVLKANYLWPVTDHDDVRFQDPPPLPPEAYRQRDTLLGAMQYVTGVTPYTTGAGQTQGAGDTATGISVFNNAASKLLEFKARMIALKVYQRAYEQWKDLTQQFLTQPQWVKITGAPPGEEWVQYGPQDIYGDYDVRVEAGEESLNRAQKRTEAVAVANAMAPYITVFPQLAKPIVQQIGRAYGWSQDELNAALQAVAPPAAPPAAAPTPFQNGNGQLVPPPQMAGLAGNAR